MKKLQKMGKLNLEKVDVYFPCLSCGIEILLDKKYYVPPKSRIIYCVQCQRANKHYILPHQLERYRREAKHRKIDFIITEQDIDDILLSQNYLCKYSNQPLKFDYYNPDRKLIKGNASIDRIDSNGSYNVENIQIILKDLNMLKGWFSDQKFKELCLLVAKNL